MKLQYLTLTFIKKKKTKVVKKNSDRKTKI